MRARVCVCVCVLRVFCSLLAVRTVICFDAAKDIAAHTHRIGRASRGQSVEAALGQAFTLVSGVFFLYIVS